MKIVLLEGLGVSDEVIERHAAKLKEMGHSFFTCEKDPAPQAQLVNSRDADVIMLANMPLDVSVIREEKALKLMESGMASGMNSAMAGSLK